MDEHSSPDPSGINGAGPQPADQQPIVGPATVLDERIDEAVIESKGQHAATMAEPGGGHGGHETFLGLDSYAWVAIAFVLFVAILWRVGAFRAIGSALDQKAVRIRADLAEAAALRAEAEALKQRAAAEAQQAAADAGAILAGAEAEARRILDHAAQETEAVIARRTRLAEDRLAAQARSAERELRQRAADITIAASRAVLARRGADGELAGLIDRSIADLDQR
jgi:F-type H+-transporting ATPase subunit b